MSKSVEKHGGIRRLNVRKVVSIVVSVMLPLAGFWMIKDGQWTKRQKNCLHALSVICFVMLVAVVFWPTQSKEGGITYVERKPNVEVYGPELPGASVATYIAPASRPLFAPERDEGVTYVYAAISGPYYHLNGCGQAGRETNMLTPYAAHYMGYQVCPYCNPPAYVAPNQ